MMQARITIKRGNEVLIDRAPVEVNILSHPTNMESLKQEGTIETLFAVERAINSTPSPLRCWIEVEDQKGATP